MTNQLPVFHLISFGRGHGQPDPAADTVIDVAPWFRDPHVSPEMRHMTGLDDLVMTNVLNTDGVREHATAHFLAALTLARLPRERPVFIAICCVGGRHRSVAIARYLDRLADAAELECVVEHRDVTLPVLVR